MSKRLTVSLFASSTLLWAACGGNDTRAAMPEVASHDQSADDLGLAAAEETPAEGEGTEGGEAPPAGPTVVALESTPIEGPTPTLRIDAPRTGTTVRRGDITIRFTLANWQLASPQGPHVHVIVDNEPYIAVRATTPFNLNQLVRDNLGHELTEGTHVVRMFPSRGHHESVKDAGAFATLIVHYRSVTEGVVFDPTAPLLTYSRPKGCNVAGQPVLLDFFVSNATLGADQYRVRYTLDGASGDITSWVPHELRSLTAGEHRLGLALIGPDGQTVPGPYNDTTRTFTVAETCN